MKHFKIFAILLWMCCALSCSETEKVENGVVRERRICLSFGSAETNRSDLNSSDVGYEHIGQVVLYGFKGTDWNAPCVMKKDIHWEKGSIQKKYWISSPLADHSTYTFIAVGWDEETGPAYSFPDHDGITVGQSTLSQLVARLGQGKGKNELAHAELFAGQTQAEVVDQSQIQIHLTLCRKVAGVLAYLRNIPYQVSKDGHDYVVEAVKVRLHSPQHTELQLWKPDAREVYGRGNLGDDDQYLFQWDMTGYEFDAEDNIYTIPAQNGAGTPVTLENTLLQGAFLLPLEKSTQPTLSIELWGKDTLGKEFLLKNYKVDHKGELLFDLKENCLYGIGKKVAAESTDGDYPADLQGNKVELEVLDWETFVTNHSFNSVVGPANILPPFDDEVFFFDAIGNSFDIFVKSGKNPDKTTPPWKLTVNYERSFKDEQGNSHTPGNPTFDDSQLPCMKEWIHLSTLNENHQPKSYLNEINSASGDDQIIRVTLNDYAIQRSLASDGKGYTQELSDRFAQDYRIAYLELQTTGSPKPFRLTIKQYNTLTVAVRADDKKRKPYIYRGMARLNHGCYVDAETGEVKDPSHRYDWGYYTSINYYIYGSDHMNSLDGEDNAKVVYKRYKDDKGASNGYVGSLFDKLYKPVNDFKAVPGQPILNRSEQLWYLPAYYEMWDICESMKSDRPVYQQTADLFGIHIGDVYWTSTGCQVPPTHSYTAVAGKSESSKNNEDRETFQLVRTIRHFDPAQQHKP